MTYSGSTLSRLGLGLALIALAGAAYGESTRDLIRQGNAACAEGNFNAALDAYEAASVEDPESPWIYYNRGIAFFGLEQYDQAKEAFEAAAIKSDDLGLEARAQYNLGHCSFREAERQRDSDLQKTVEAIEQSIRYYQEALKIDPEMKDAATNIEVARITLKAILDELKKQQEEQQQQQELMQKLEELIKRQEACNTTTHQAAQANDAAQAGALNQDQGAIRAETQAFGKELDQQIAAQQQAMQQAQQQAQQQPQPMQSPLAAVTQDIDAAITGQEEAEAALAQENLSGAEPPQKAALEALKAAKEKMQGDQEQQQQQQNQQQQQQQQQQQEQQQGEQGEEDQQKQEQEQESGEDQQDQLQQALEESPEDILDEEEENKEKRQVIPQGGYRPVDKDW